METTKTVAEGTLSKQEDLDSYSYRCGQCEEEGGYIFTSWEEAHAQLKEHWEQQHPQA
jgi:hypothetical protein